METWMILLLIALVAIILYFAMKRTTLPIPNEPVAVPIQRAPGVSTTTGEVLNNPPPPPPPSVTARFKAIATPSNVLQHVPVVGGSAATLARLPMKAGFAVTDKINSSLSHIPVVGSALAAPGKAITNIGKSLTSWL